MGRNVYSWPGRIHGKIVVTRNVKDFARFDVRVFDHFRADELNGTILLATCSFTQVVFLFSLLSPLFRFPVRPSKSGSKLISQDRDALHFLPHPG